MSFELTILTGLIALLALVAVIRPSVLFAYPVAGAMLMWFFLVPQAWRVESSGEMNDFEPTLTWAYMILCVVMTVIGFYVGGIRTPLNGKNDLASLSERYDLNKLFIGAVLLVAVGGVAQILLSRGVATMKPGDLFTGALAFYVMISALLIYGATLGWLLYLYTGNKKALGLALIGLAVTLPTILFYARRELSFTVASIIFLGFWFVRKRTISRLLLIPLVLAGAALVNQAGAIRGYIATNDSTLIGALSEGELEDTSQNKNKFDEMASGVSDIAIATWSDEYAFFAPYYNTLVQLYVPAFIFGHDVKDALKYSQYEGDTDEYAKYFANGATRTGFADSFQAFHYFGCLIFFAISYYMGGLWKRANSGDILSQLYYMILLAAGLKVFTESTSIFIGVLPLMVGSTFAIFRYARRTQSAAHADRIVPCRTNPHRLTGNFARVMIAFLDVNTIWRRKFADALKRRDGTVLLVAPASPIVKDLDSNIVPIRLIHGWAGPLAWLALPWLLWRMRRIARDGELATIVVTTPHYLPLARRAARHSAIVYYCSDDYRAYSGWDPVRMKRDEAALCRIATLSIFVSEALRARAVADYGLDPARTRVSPNATEPRFAGPHTRPAAIGALPGPIFGAAGVLNTRIDLAFLAAVAADPRVGSLALVGPVEAALEDDPMLERLRTDSKVHFLGAQPHADMPQWMAAFDVAVIPYANTPFNHFCSPMRLYDHLAIGQPIIATPYCDQIAAREDVLSGDMAALPSLISAALAAAAMNRTSRLETWDDRIDALQKSPVAGFSFPQ